MNIDLLVAAENTTGSKTLIEFEGKRILVDCGLFLGLKELRLKNWERPPIDFSVIDAIVLSSSQIDHCGYLPLAERYGFKGPILCTELTMALTKVTLSEHSKNEVFAAKLANEHQYTKHDPALPLFEDADVKAVIAFFLPISYKERCMVGDISVELIKSNYRPGTASVILRHKKQTICLSGDIGRKSSFLIPVKVEHPRFADIVICESKKGDHRSPNIDPVVYFEQLLLDCIEKEGTILVPSYAADHVLELVYVLSRLHYMYPKLKIPVFVDAPQGIQIQDIANKYRKELHLLESDLEFLSNDVKYVDDPRDTMAVIAHKGPKLVVAGHSMVTGGRILSYMEALISEGSTTILLLGDQVIGTRGYKLQQGDRRLTIFGKVHTVKAKIETIDIFSGAASQLEVMDWPRGFQNKVQQVILNNNNYEGQIY